MSNELENIAKNLSDTVNGKGGFRMEQIIKLLSTENGKRVLATLMADGGARIKNAAEGAKRGDLGGVSSIISSIAETEDGRQILSELVNNGGK